MTDTDTPLRIEEYPSQPACLHPYDPQAPAVAAAVAELVEGQAPALRVEHIGSTAVPGCDGKGIIDLMLLYGPGGLEAAKQLLAELGFQHQKSGNRFPETRPMRIGAVRFGSRLYRLHIHVLDTAADEVRRLRRFRDRLRDNPELRQAYISHKRDILDQGLTEPLDYTRAKSVFFEMEAAG